MVLRDSAVARWDTPARARHRLPAPSTISITDVWTFPAQSIAYVAAPSAAVRRDAPRRRARSRSPRFRPHGVRAPPETPELRASWSRPVRPGGPTPIGGARPRANPAAHAQFRIDPWPPASTGDCRARSSDRAIRTIDASTGDIPCRCPRRPWRAEAGLPPRRRGRRHHEEHTPTVRIVSAVPPAEAPRTTGIQNAKNRSAGTCAGRTNAFACGAIGTGRHGRTRRQHADRTPHREPRAGAARGRASRLMWSQKTAAMPSGMPMCANSVRKKNDARDAAAHR